MKNLFVFWTKYLRKINCKETLVLEINEQLMEEAEEEYLTGTSDNQR